MATLIARWESRGGAHIAELHKAPGSGYYYRATGAGGYLGNDLSEAEAIAIMEKRCAVGGGLQPDSNKTPMKRVA